MHAILQLLQTSQHHSCCCTLHSFQAFLPDKGFVNKVCSNWEVVANSVQQLLRRPGKYCVESLATTMILSLVESINCGTGRNSKVRQTTALCNTLNCQSLQAPLISNYFPKLLNYRQNFIYQPAVREKGLIKLTAALEWGSISLTTKE